MTPQPTPERLRCECKHYWVDHKDDAQLSCAECKCGSWRPTPQTPSVNSREDTGPSADTSQDQTVKDSLTVTPDNNSTLVDTVGGEEVCQCGHRESSHTTTPNMDCICTKKECQCYRFTPPSKQSEECECGHDVKEHSQGNARRGSYCLHFEGSTECSCQSYRVTPPKAEGVGERMDKASREILGCILWNALRGDSGDLIRAEEGVVDFFNNLLTSATRAAEERKDGEYKAEIIRLHDQDYPHGSDNPDFIMGYKNAMRDLLTKNGV